MKSIQRQLTLKVVAGSVVLSLAAGLALYLAVRWALFAHQDNALLFEAHALSGLVHFLPNGQLEFDFSPANIPDFQSAHPAGYFEIRQTDGTLLTRSPSMRPSDSLTPPASAPSAVHWDITLRSNRLGRAAQITFIPELDDDEPLSTPRPASLPAPQPLILRLARDRTHLQTTLTIVSTWLIATTAAFTLATALMVTVTVRRGLRPLRRLSIDVAGIDVHRLDQPLILEGLPTELQPIASRTNELLRRLHAVFQRERRFTADVAHELRTPVAELKTLAEVALKWPDTPQPAGDFRDVLAIAQQMERLIITLLDLARAQTGRISTNHSQINLEELVRATWDPLAELASKKRLQVTWANPQPAFIASDPAIIKSIVRNLLENAVDYTTPGQSIAITIQQRSDTSVLTIANDTTAIDPSDLPHLFEPFWRKDPARAGSNHQGVGLALVAAYAKLTGAQLDATQPKSNQLSISIAWPSVTHIAANTPEPAFT